MVRLATNPHNCNSVHTTTSSPIHIYIYFIYITLPLTSTGTSHLKRESIKPFMLNLIRIGTNQSMASLPMFYFYFFPSDLPACNIPQPQPLSPLPFSQNKNNHPLPQHFITTTLSTHWLRKVQVEHPFFIRLALNDTGGFLINFIVHMNNYNTFILDKSLNHLKC